MMITVEVTTLDAERVTVNVYAPGEKPSGLILLESDLEKYLSELEKTAMAGGQTVTVTRAPEREARRRA